MKNHLMYKVLSEVSAFKIKEYITFINVGKKQDANTINIIPSTNVFPMVKKKVSKLNTIIPNPIAASR